MRADRRRMTARVVALRSAEAAESFVAGSLSERIALVARLSAQLWALTGRELPTYTRATMPVAVRSLHDRLDV